MYLRVPMCFYFVVKIVYKYHDIRLVLEQWRKRFLKMAAIFPLNDSRHIYSLVL